VKLVTFEHQGRQAIGAVHGEQIVELQGALVAALTAEGDPNADVIARIRIPSEMLTYLQGGPGAWAAVEQAFAWGVARGPSIALDEVKLKAPFIPVTIICGGANFYDHIDETHRDIPDEVEFFLKSPHSVVGPNEVVRLDRRVSRKFDYEVELGIVIGRPGRDIPKEKAFEHIYGYTIFNDISARDRQVIPWTVPGGKDAGPGTVGRPRFQLRFGEGKSYDMGGPIGPWIVTRDELPDVSNLQLRTWVNEDLRQNNNTRNLIWDVPSLVSYYSTFMTLQPGFLIISGTPGGPGLGSDVELGANPYARKDGVQRGRYLQGGDVMRLEIEGIGQLENPLEEA
jgi:2-keto-4-pentenoate hydratase/2-oxohepta-3-ene-1,7-dioic acid hydratase in catechol pathway